MFFATAVLSLWTAFVTPSAESRPWCYWWWINGHADKETITADLEAMKRLGFGGVLMFDSRNYWDCEDFIVNPKAEIQWGSPEWYDLVEFSIRECARLGLVFTMNASASGGKLNGFIDGKEYETDIMNRTEVVAHLDRVVDPLLKRVPDLVGKTFTHIYSVSYEGNVRTGGSWSAINDAFYTTMRNWAHANGLKIYSESGGPWFWGATAARLDCDQLDLLANNDFPQGEFWPNHENLTNPETGHANKNGRFFQHAVMLSALREGRHIVSMESFTHMRRHYSVDPSFLKPLADIAFADGANRLVWHTFTCSPEKFGVPGAEYFAGSHVNRNVTWHNDAAAFVKYLGRCQALLQRGEYVDDGEFINVKTNYYGFGRYRKDENAQFTTTHRREGNIDWFFVAGEGKGEVLLNTAINGRSVEVWDAVSVKRTAVAAADAGGGKTRVALDLPIGGSCFVVFAPNSSSTRFKGLDDNLVNHVNPVKNTYPITNAWRVSFAYHDGIAAPPPEPIVMETLRDWTTYGADGDAASTSLRYFSGTATYRTTFIHSLTPPLLHSSNLTLSLGSVPTGLAHVFVNGKDCGVAWCAPWEVDIASAVREGENEIEIRYTNNWYNRLVGDCFLKTEERVTRSTLRYWRQSQKNEADADRSHRRMLFSGPAADDPLQPSGLHGPIHLKATRFPARTSGFLGASSEILMRSSEWIPLAGKKDIIAGSALDFSTLGLVDAPAGKHGFTCVRNGHFEFENRSGVRQRFYGVNLCFGANFPEPEETDSYVKRLVRLGYNAIRIHHHERLLLKGAKDRRTFNPEMSDRLDRLIASAITNGLYVTTDLYTSRTVYWEDIGSPEGRKGIVNKHMFKGLIPVYEPAFENWKRFASDFLLHRNPYTGRRYVDEPGLATIVSVNEGPMETAWDQLCTLPFVRDAYRRWCEADPSRAIYATECPEKMRSPVIAGPMESGLALFQADMERSAAIRQREFLRSIGLKIPISGFNGQNIHFIPTQTLRSGTYDYVDEHFYQDHPVFLKGWWKLPSRSLNANPLKDPSGLKMCRISFFRVPGKPFTISEWNFAGPGEFRGMGGILSGVCAARQDWDGLWRFAYAHTMDNVREGKGAINYFDVAVDPVALAADRAMVCLFLRGDLNAAGAKVLLTTDVRSERPAGKAFPVHPDWSGIVPWRTQVAVASESAAWPGAKSYAWYDVARPGIGMPPKDIPADSIGFEIDAARGSFVLATPRTSGGFVERGGLTAGDVLSVSDVTIPSTVWVSSLDYAEISKSERLLLCHLTDVQAEGTMYEDSSHRVLLEWGKGVPLVKRGFARVSVRMEKPERMEVFALDTSGARCAAIHATATYDRLEFDVDSSCYGLGCMLYEIVRKKGD
jgi:hypothetical protein